MNRVIPIEKWSNYSKEKKKNFTPCICGQVIICACGTNGIIKPLSPTDQVDHTYQVIFNPIIENIICDDTDDVIEEEEGEDTGSNTSASSSHEVSTDQSPKMNQPTSI